MHDSKIFYAYKLLFQDIFAEEQIIRKVVLGDLKRNAFLTLRTIVCDSMH